MQVVTLTCLGWQAPIGISATQGLAFVPFARFEHHAGRSVAQQAKLATFV
jgi:hypothetical protein